MVEGEMNDKTYRVEMVGRRRMKHIRGHWQHTIRSRRSSTATNTPNNKQLITLSILIWSAFVSTEKKNAITSLPLQN